MNEPNNAPSCASCGKPLQVSAKVRRGRPSEYCSESCRRAREELRAAWDRIVARISEQSLLPDSQRIVGTREADEAELREWLALHPRP